MINTPHSYELQPPPPPTHLNLTPPPPPHNRLLGEGVWADADRWGAKWGRGVSSSRLKLRVGHE